MFGYIAPVFSVLSDEQKDRYHSVYCGVCHALRKRFGQTGRISLSNDMTFLALLLSSLYEPEEPNSISRCIVHPIRSHSFLSSSLINYAADMNALLFYYKCMDQRLDDHSLAGNACERVFKKKCEKVKSIWKSQSETVETALNELWKEEKKEFPNPDRLCNLSGMMLSAVFVPMPDDIWAPVLRNIGESLGRFVYWMDAWEDLEQDLKRNRFNPLSSWRQRSDYEDWCHETLELLISEAARSFEILPLEKDLDLLRNVLYSGVWQKYTLKMKSKNRKEEIHGERSV